MSNTELWGAVDELERKLMAKGVQRFPKELLNVRLDEGEEQERQRQLDEARDRERAKGQGQGQGQGREEKVEEEDADAADGVGDGDGDGDGVQKAKGGAVEQPRVESLDDELRRISKMMALQRLEDPTGPSFYDTCNKISSLAKAGGVEDAQSMSKEAKDKAMAKQLAELKTLRPANKALIQGFFDAAPARSQNKLRRSAHRPRSEGRATSTPDRREERRVDPQEGDSAKGARGVPHYRDAAHPRRAPLQVRGQHRR